MQQPRNFARWPHSKKGGSTLLSWKPLVISQRSSILICKGFLSDNISMLWLPSKISWFITLQKTWPQIDPCNSLKKKGSLKAHHKLFPFNVDIKKIDRCISFLNEKMKLEKVKNYWGNGDGQGEFSSLKCSLSTIDEAGSRLCWRKADGRQFSPIHWPSFHSPWFWDLTRQWINSPRCNLL